jgi:hypothetical protein
MKWLEKRGFTWEKICAGPGDLIIWDSRLPHYNLSPTQETPRFCVYTCYMPVKDVSQDDLVKKKEAFYGMLLSTQAYIAVLLSISRISRYFSLAKCSSGQ